MTTSVWFCGFRQGRGTRDQTVILTKVLAQVQEVARARVGRDHLSSTIPLASIVFLDYIGTFDSIDHCFLDEALRHGGASDKTRACNRSVYNNASAMVRVVDSAGQTAMSDPFPIRRRVGRHCGHTLRRRRCLQLGGVGTRMESE